MTTTTPSDDSGVLSLDAELTLFGFPPREVEVDVRPRSKAWRLAGAARTFGIFAVIAPFAAIVPPHAPWALGALGAGVILGRKRWMEEFTLERLDSDCPKCGQAISARGVRLRFPHPVMCEGCHHQASLKVPRASLTEPS